MKPTHKRPIYIFLKSSWSPWYPSISRLSLSDFKYQRSTTRRLSADALVRELGCHLSPKSGATISRENSMVCMGYWPIKELDLNNGWRFDTEAKVFISAAISALDQQSTSKRSSFRFWSDSWDRVMASFSHCNYCCRCRWSASICLHV